MLQILRQILPRCNVRFIQSRYFSNADNAPVDEKLILEKLKLSFPNASSINVEDTSGGCGAMFNVSVETKDFKGLTIMKQHRKVYEALKNEMPKLHGLHLETKITD